MPKESDDWVVFKDEKGNEWTRANIKELIEGYRSYKRFLEVLSHYKDLF